MVSEVREVSYHEILKRIEKTFQELRDMVKKKGSEYSSEADILSNFRDGMHLTGLGADYYLLSLMAKHVIWLYSEARKKETPNKALFREHKRDIILYLELLDCLYFDEHKQSGG